MTDGLTNTHSLTHIQAICILSGQERATLSRERLGKVPDMKLSSWAGICISLLAQSLTVCHVYCPNLSWYKGLQHRNTTEQTDRLDV